MYILVVFVTSPEPAHCSNQLGIPIRMILLLQAGFLPFAPHHDYHLQTLMFDQIRPNKETFEYF